MKRNWWKILVAVTVVIGFGFLANIAEVQSAPDDAKVTEGKPNPKASKGKKFKIKTGNASANPCPAGWKKVAYEDAGMFTCKPKKPKKKKKCPPKSEWFFDGCMCGCKKLIY